jgi:hypothetical protein
MQLLKAQNTRALCSWVKLSVRNNQIKQANLIILSSSKNAIEDHRKLFLLVIS